MEPVLWFMVLVVVSFLWIANYQYFTVLPFTYFLVLRTSENNYLSFLIQKAYQRSFADQGIDSRTIYEHDITFEDTEKRSHIERFYTLHTTEKMSESKEYTYAEAAEHKTKKDLFMVIHDKVYDTSAFVDEHP